MPVTRAARGMTLVELLVVIVIITILISAIVVASSTLINKAKVSSTRAMLLVVRDAVEQFKREQEANPTLTRDPDYVPRYGLFPPDELEVFTPIGIPNEASPVSHAVGGATILLASASEQPYEPSGSMNFYTRGLDVDQAAVEHRDLAALVVTIEMFGDASAAILDRVQDRYRTPGPVDDDGIPMLFLDRPGATGALSNNWDSGDLQIRYIIDEWGVPISYITQRDWDPTAPTPPPTRSENHPAWNEASTRMVHLNHGQPIIMSYGPNGREQLTKEQMDDPSTHGGKATLFVDLLEDKEHKINHLLNADNVYPDPALNERLARGTPE
ncbi:MAG: prepilin-type N-terminal cleavage/methylation domain-containing protein [Phycisphaerae bacterium]